MIKRLRKRFICIAMAAVASVMVLLCLIVNIANYISVDRELCQMLTVIHDNQGVIPHTPSRVNPAVKQDGSFTGQFTAETPYSTRFFVLRYNDEGELVGAQLDKIAAVTEEDTDKYLEIAMQNGEGFGYTSGYKFYVVDDGDDRNMAIFLDCYQEMRGVIMTAVWSLAAAVFCIVLVYLIVVLLSRIAIDPVIKASEKQKQFITDAGHELKTPITVIATSLKVLEMETGEQKWIDKAKAQTEKLKELVNSLVSLSRMDEENSPLKFVRFAVSDAVRETAESFIDYAKSAGHELTLSIEPDIIYCGDEYAVRRLVSVLLDNAVKYAEKDSQIYFSLEKNKKGIVIRTSNKCEGLSSEDEEKLFDRFWRADESRSSAGGFGIGLSMARSIAEGHKGTISAKIAEGVITFTAELKNQ